MRLKHWGAVVLAALLTTALLQPLPARADDTDPMGIKLKQALEEPAAQKVLEEKGPPSAGDPTGLLCDAEMVTVVGAIIWDQRRMRDHCKSMWRSTAIEYCWVYSRVCDHYHWNPDCLRNYWKDHPEACD